MRLSAAVFAQGTNSATVGAGAEFSGNAGKLTVSADFDDNTFTLTFTNDKAAGGASIGVPATAGMLFVNLDVHDGTSLAGVTNVSGTLSGNALTAAQIANIGLTAGFNTTVGGPSLQGGFLFVDLPAFTVQAGNSATLSGTFVTVPEPGSVALVGAVLLALAFVRLDKVRSFGSRLMGRGLAS